jgi:hypothetical protein
MILTKKTRLKSYSIPFALRRCLLLKKILPAIASVIAVAVIIVVALIFLRIWRIPFFQVEVLGISHSAVHWIGWVGALYIALATPIYPIIKRKYSHLIDKTLSIHVTGNLIGVLFVSIHFAHQVTRPISSYPDLGTGIVLYVAMIMLSATGLISITGIGRQFYKQIRFLHPAFAITFYTVIVMHILEDLLISSMFT